MNKEDSRYPYTYSADYIRELTDTLVLSRSDAAYIVGRIASIIGMDDRELKSKIADQYIKENT